MDAKKGPSNYRSNNNIPFFHVSGKQQREAHIWFTCINMPLLPPAGFLQGRSVFDSATKRVATSTNESFIFHKIIDKRKCISATEISNNHFNALRYNVTLFRVPFSEIAFWDNNHSSNISPHEVSYISSSSKLRLQRLHSRNT